MTKTCMPIGGVSRPISIMFTPARRAANRRHRGAPVDDPVRLGLDSDRAARRGAAQTCAMARSASCARPQALGQPPRCDSFIHLRLAVRSAGAGRDLGTRRGAPARAEHAIPWLGGVRRDRAAAGRDAKAQLRRRGCEREDRGAAGGAVVDARARRAAEWEAAAYALVWTQAIQSVPIGAWLAWREPRSLRVIAREWRLSMVAGAFGAISASG